MSHLVHSMAGAVAEEKVSPSVHGSGCDNMDSQYQYRLAGIAVCNATYLGGGRNVITPEEWKRNEGRLNALFECARTAAAQIVAGHWRAIEGVAAQLLEREQLSGAEVAEIVAANRVSAV